MRRNIFVLIILAIFSKFLGFFREILMSYYYGTSEISDVYYVSQTIPTVIFSLFATGLIASYIPVYLDIRSSKGEDAAEKFSQNLINVFGLLGLFLSIATCIFSEKIVKVFAYGFREETFKLAVIYTRISSISIFFLAEKYTFSGYLQAKKFFLSSEIIGFPYNFILIICIILSVLISHYFLPIGIVLAALAQGGTLYFFVKKRGFKISYTINFNDPFIKKVIYLALPITIGTSINQLNKLVDKSVASTLAVGAVSALNYSNRIIYMITEIFAMSLSMVIFPELTQKSIEKKYLEYNSLFGKSIKYLTLLLLPISIGCLFFSKEIIYLLFGRGAFEEQAILMTAGTLFFYAIGIPATGLREIYSRAFYSFNDTKTTIINSGIAVIVNIILNFVLSLFLGVNGLALATSIAAILSTSLLAWSFNKKNIKISFSYMSKDIIKIFIASLLMGIIGKIHLTFLLNFIHARSAILLIIIFCVFLYIFLVFLLKISECEKIINDLNVKIRSRFNK